MNNPPYDGPLFFMDLWRLHRFHVDFVAIQAEVSEETILTMLRYQPVSKEDAQKVLAVLSELYQQEYTLSTVSIRLLPEGDAGTSAVK